MGEQIQQIWNDNNHSLSLETTLNELPWVIQSNMISPKKSSSRTVNNNNSTLKCKKVFLLNFYAYSQKTNCNHIFIFDTTAADMSWKVCLANLTTQEIHERTMMSVRAELNTSSYHLCVSQLWSVVELR